MVQLARSFNYGKKVNPKSKKPDVPENQWAEKARRERLLKALGKEMQHEDNET